MRDRELAWWLYGINLKLDYLIRHHKVELSPEDRLAVQQATADLKASGTALDAATQPPQS